MYILQINDDEATRLCAEKLAGLEWDTQEIPNMLRQFPHSNCLEGLNTQSLRHFVFLGHTSTSHYGNYSAREFAALFAEKFQEANYTHTDRLLVEDLYLIGCGLGMSKSNDKSLAQEIANEMAKAGFRNVKIHAFSNPDNIPAQSEMIVEITTQAGISALNGNQEGYIKTYVLNSHQSKEMMRLENKLEHEQDQHKKYLIKRDMEQLKEKAVCFINLTNPVTELKKPKNIFIPEETYTARRVRILCDPYTLSEMKRIEHENSQEIFKQHAIRIIRLRRQHEQEKLQRNRNKLLENPVETLRIQELLENLDLLTNALENVKAVETQKLIELNLDIFKSMLGLHKISTTYKMLSGLSNGEMIDPDSISLGKKDREKAEKTQKLTDKLNSTKETTSEKQPLLQQQAPAQHADTIFVRLRNEIHALRDILSEEAEAKSQSCLSFFYLYEIETKTQKYEALNTLLRVNNLEDLQKIASSLLVDDRVMRSIKTSRVRDLMHKILEYKSEAAGMALNSLK